MGALVSTTLLGEFHGSKESGLGGIQGQDHISECHHELLLVGELLHVLHGGRSEDHDDGFLHLGDHPSLEAEV